MTVPWEKWKTNDRFSTFPPGARDDDDGSLSEPKNQKKGSRPLRGLLILYAALPPVERNRFHAHPSIGKCSGVDACPQDQPRVPPATPRCLRVRISRTA